MRFTKLAAVALVAAVGVAGCGKSKPSGGESAFCKGLLSLDKVSTPGGPGEDPVQANKDFGNAAAAPIQSLIANAPASLKSAVAKEDAAAKKAATGDASGGDEAGADKAPLEAWAFGHCNYNTISVSAKNYAYTGMPKTVKAGDTVIKFKNTANQPHIMLWLARKDGDTRPAVDVINAVFAANGFDQFLQGDPAGAPPGQTGGITMNLPKGKYIVFCPIGVNGNENDSHYMHGMHAEVTVQ